jgi:Arc/MetJ family transcription regulator
MRTTLDIDARLMEEVVKATGGATKRKAFEIALSEYLRAKRRQDLAGRIGHFEDFDLTLEELEEMRSGR